MKNCFLLLSFGCAVLAAGASRRVTFTLPLELFARWRGERDGAWVIEPGEYEIRVGCNAWDKSHVLSVRLEGKTLHFPRRTVFFSSAEPDNR